MHGCTNPVTGLVRKETQGLVSEKIKGDCSQAEEVLNQMMAYVLYVPTLILNAILNPRHWICCV